MEEVPTNKRVPDVEAEANYEGNDTLLLVERLENPSIFNQIVDLLYQAEQANGHGPVLTIHEMDEDGKLLYDEKGKPILITGETAPRQREELKNGLENRIEEVKKYTPVSFDPKSESNAR